jgi:hypothetical protein
LGFSYAAESDNPVLYIASNNEGTAVVVSDGPQVYVLSVATGLTTSNFTLPNSDVIPIFFNFTQLAGFPLVLYDALGFLVAVAPDDTLYFVDDNTNSSSLHVLYHTTSTGTLLAAAALNFTEYGFATAFSLSVDSAGVVYIAGGGPATLALKVDGSSLEVIGTLTVPYTSVGVGTGADYLELSISWGTTPAQDALYAQVGQGASRCTCSTAPAWCRAPSLPTTE